MKTGNFECILKILEHDFSLPIFPRRRTDELSVFFEKLSTRMTSTNQSF